jgi:glucan phosphoethanolaminetransferase (alkaline phosphatase superfamily)
VSGKAIDLPFAVRGRKVPAQVVFFLALSSLHTVLFNGERIIWWSEGDVVSALTLGALQATMFLGLLMALSFWRGVLIVGTALAVLVSSSASYFISTFQLKAFGPNTMALVAGTNLEEAAGFLSQELVLTTALAVLLSILATWASGSSSRDLRRW